MNAYELEKENADLKVMQERLKKALEKRDAQYKEIKKDFLQVAGAVVGIKDMISNNPSMLMEVMTSTTKRKEIQDQFGDVVSLLEKHK